MTINEFMTSEHRNCDEEFANLENAVDKEDWDNANGFFTRFQSKMLRHFNQEEKVMFEAYNNSDGGHCNPTGMMIMEHDQMRALFEQMENAINLKDKDNFLGLSENLLFVMQQHNMKEEQMMYNMADEALNAENIIDQMKQIA
jgi:hemerythrin-like domain-containing protein